MSDRGSYIVFVDEAGFMLTPLVRRTWAPRGCTPVLKVADTHERISAIAAITIIPVRDRFGSYFQLLEDNANYRSESIVQFLEFVRQKIRSPMILLWDEIPIHRSDVVKKYLAKHRDIAIEPFPPYAPELNPVDYMWSYVKYGRLANYCPHNLDELRNEVASELCRLKRRPDLLESFFRATGLTL